MTGPLDSRETASAWYAVHCRPLKEFQAQALLRDRFGMRTYLPTLRNRVQGATREACFFPGYLFVWVGSEVGDLSVVNQTPGVIRLVEFGGERPRVPEGVVAAIKERVDALNAQGGLPVHKFHPGETVEIKSGPLAGLQAVFVGPLTPHARVKVLLEFLGGLHQAEVAVEALTGAPGSSAANGQRRTRGQGRRVRGARPG